MAFAMKDLKGWAEEQKDWRFSFARTSGLAPLEAPADVPQEPGVLDGRMGALRMERTRTPLGAQRTEYRSALEYLRAEVPGMRSAAQERTPGPEAVPRDTGASTGT